MVDDSATAAADYEAIIIGAGVCGIYQLYRLLELGVHTTVLETGDDLGGTWFWNRYPGARFDSESITYGYSFSEELLQEWDWKERFSGQPENLRYLNYVVDKFDLRRHMQFGVHRRVGRRGTTTTDCWRLHLDDGRDLTLPLPDHRHRAAVGADAAALRGPRRASRASSFHTYNWPEEPVELAGKRVAVIGTGATGVQVIGAIADKVGELTVFQRRPELVRPAPQRRDHARGDGRHQGPLRRDLRHLRPHARRLHPRAGPPPVLRGAPRGAPGQVGAALRRARLRHLAGQLPRHLHGRGGQRRVLRVHRRQDPLTGRTTPWWPRS